MANNWNIKISEGKLGVASGFFVSVDNNGKYQRAIKGMVNSFDEALAQGKTMVLQIRSEQKDKYEKAKKITKDLSKQFILSGMFNGIYGIGTMYKDNEPYVEIRMDTKNDKLMKLVPDSVDGIKVEKVFGTMTVAQAPTKK